MNVEMNDCLTQFLKDLLDELLSWKHVQFYKLCPLQLETDLDSGIESQFYGDWWKRKQGDEDEGEDENQVQQDQEGVDASQCAVHSCTD